LATAQNLGIEVRSSQDNDLRILGDEERLVQVVVNLLSNAIKFSKKGDSILVETHARKDMVEITVQDQGRGVPLHLQETIFEKFKQVERDDDTKKGGTGLGLAICKAIVERHGGSIGVHPNPQGAGSTFWFRIPAAKPFDLQKEQI
jgi:signal transduction histidine kinase